MNTSISHNLKKKNNHYAFYNSFYYEYMIPMLSFNRKIALYSQHLTAALLLIPFSNELCRVGLNRERERERERERKREGERGTSMT